MDLFTPLTTSNFSFLHSPRRYVFRALVIATIACIVGRLIIHFDKSPDSEPPYFAASILVWCFIVFHHVSSVCRFKALLTLFDLILVALELSAWFALHSYSIQFDRWSSEGRVLLKAALYIQLLSLISLFGFRFADIVRSHGSNLCSPVDLFSKSLPRRIAPGNQPPPHPYWSLLFEISLLESLCIMFGIYPWKPRIRQEHRAIIYLRGFFAISLILVLLSFGTYVVIIGPVRETGFFPTKMIRTSDPKYDFPMEVPVWSILAFMDMENPAATQVEKFKKAVNVTALWDDSELSKPQCEPLRGNQTLGGHLPSGVQTDPFIQVITFFCPNRLGYNLSARKVMESRSSRTTPDLLITIDFTALDTSDSLIDTRLNAVSILVGLSNTTADVVDNTLPTSLTPGSHLFGSVSREFRRRYHYPFLAALGVPTASKTFLIGNIASLVTDPSPLVPRLENTATLRLYGPNDISDWVITEDSRERSVVGGLAAVGGFWTVVNGIFAVCFGGSLLLRLAGIKPLSVLGIADQIQRHQHPDPWSVKYVDLKEQIRREEGLVAFLQDHLIDFHLNSDGADADNGATRGSSAAG